MESPRGQMGDAWGVTDGGSVRAGGTHEPSTERTAPTLTSPPVTTTLLTNPASTNRPLPGPKQLRPPMASTSPEHYLNPLTVTIVDPTLNEATPQPRPGPNLDPRPAGHEPLNPHFPL